jgi:hypothetical protein
VVTVCLRRPRSQQMQHRLSDIPAWATDPRSRSPHAAKTRDRNIKLRSGHADASNLRAVFVASYTDTPRTRISHR